MNQKGNESLLSRWSSVRNHWLVARILILLAVFPVLVQAQFEVIPFSYTTANGKVTVTGYTGIATDVVIPPTILGLPVIAIGDSAFAFKGNLTSMTIPNSVTTIGISAFDFCSGLRTVTIGTNVNHIRSFAFRMCHGLTNFVVPASVTNIGYQAFFACSSLTNISFKGNAPTLEETAFTFSPATVYYLPTKTGWRPGMLTTANTLGVRTDGFGISIQGTPGLGIVVEASTNFSNPVWSQVGTYSMTSNSLELVDLSWTNNSARFYRAGSANFGGLPMAPATP